MAMKRTFAKVYVWEYIQISVWEYIQISLMCGSTYNDGGDVWEYIQIPLIRV